MGKSRRCAAGSSEPGPSSPSLGPSSPASSLALSNKGDLQTEFDLITTTDAERLLLRSQSAYYEHGDKAGRLLAPHLRCQRVSHAIAQMEDLSGKLHTDPTSMNSVFCSFYSSLYKSELTSDHTETNSFLDSLNFSNKFRCCQRTRLTINARGNHLPYEKHAK